MRNEEFSIQYPLSCPPGTSHVSVFLSYLCSSYLALPILMPLPWNIGTHHGQDHSRSHPKKVAHSIWQPSIVAHDTTETGITKNCELAYVVLQIELSYERDMDSLNPTVIYPSPVQLFCWSLILLSCRLIIYLIIFLINMFIDHNRRNYMNYFKY